MKLKNRLLYNLLKPFNYLLKFIIILFGWKGSKYQELIEATIYEFRLMAFFSLLILGLFIFLGVVDNSNDPELIKIIVKVSGILLLLIIILTFRIAIKLNFKYKYHLRKNCPKLNKCCDKDSNLNKKKDLNND